MKIYAISDWANYKLVKAQSPIDAAKSMKQRDLKWIEHPSGESVTHVMVVEFSGYNETMLLKCKDDMQRVLLLNNLDDTYHFQIA
ncbi:hypothetical protein H4F05_06580 [Vibrio cholerae]